MDGSQKGFGFRVEGGVIRVLFLQGLRHFVGLHGFPMLDCFLGSSGFRV